MASSDFSQINALDPNTLGGLRRLSKQNSPEATKEAAKKASAERPVARSKRKGSRKADAEFRMPRKATGSVCWLTPMSAISEISAAARC